MRKKNLMILGANILQLPLIIRAKERGLNVIVVSNNRNLPGFKYATHSIFHDYLDLHGILHFAKKFSIDGIITDQTDMPVRTVGFVAEKLGLPGISYNTSLLFTDKYLMREKCKELGIKTLYYQKVKSLEDALSFYRYIKNELKYDAIIKPADNQASKGIFKIIDEETLENKYEYAESNSLNGELIIEQYLEGFELVVEGISFNYEFKNLICGDTFYFDLPDVFSAKKRIFPSTRNNKIIEKVLSINKKIISGFGLKQGITHSEYIIDNANNDVYLLETAARGGGVYISSDIINMQTGLKTEDFLIDIALGICHKLPNIQNKDITSGYIAFFLPLGQIIEIQGIEIVINFPFVQRHNLDSIRIGDVIHNNIDKTSRKFIIVSAPNQNLLVEHICRIKDVLTIKVIDQNRKIHTQIWD